MSGDRKRRLVVAFEKYVQNPPVRAALRAGLPLPMFALLETTGRTSGRRRQTPVINGRRGGRFWIVARTRPAGPVRPQPRGRPERASQKRRPMVRRTRAYPRRR
jgi:hypothetical protein